MKQKAFSLLLVVVMLMSLMSTVAFAAVDGAASGASGTKVSVDNKAGGGLTVTVTNTANSFPKDQKVDIVLVTETDDMKGDAVTAANFVNGNTSLINAVQARDSSINALSDCAYYSQVTVTADPVATQVTADFTSVANGKYFLLAWVVGSTEAQSVAKVAVDGNKLYIPTATITPAESAGLKMGADRTITLTLNAPAFGVDNSAGADELTAAADLKANGMVKVYDGASANNDITNDTNCTITYVPKAGATPAKITVVVPSGKLVAGEKIKVELVANKLVDEDGTAFAATSATYNVSAGEPNTVAITNKPANNKVTWGDNGNKLTLSATATKGTPTFTSGTTATATVNGTELTILQAGSTEITATVAAGTYDGTQYAAGSDNYTLTVEEGTPAITFANNAQSAGSVTAVTATATVGTVAVTPSAVKYEVPNQVFTQASCNCVATNTETDSDRHTAECAAFAAASNVYKEWTDQIIVEGKKTTVQDYINTLEGGTTVNVQATVAAVANKYTAKTETGTLTIENNVIAPPSNAFTVTYAGGAHGTIGGAATERVKKGESPKNVPTVNAHKGYTFIGWTLDGKTLVDPAAQTITKSVTFTAVYAEHNPYMIGRSATQFVPNGQMTRAEAATILARLTEGFDEDGTYPAAPYSDLDANAWYATYVNFAADKGIINGYNDGTFKPNQPITRAELATMIANFVKIAAVDDAASVSDVAGHWAAGYIAALEQAQIVKGYEDGTFRPNQAITRAEAATMVNGAIDRVPMADLDLGVNGYANPFTDVSTSQWFYEQVMEAAVGHLIVHFHG